MPTLSFTTVDVFTTERYLGNPLAIVSVPPGNGITGDQMQTLAREFNLSETVFIQALDEVAGEGLPQWRLRIFTSTAELPFAGHPTIGSSCYALGTLARGASKGRLLCNAGPVDVDYRDGVARCAIPHNFHRHTENEVTAEAVRELQPGLAEVGAVDVVSPVKGMNFVAVELPDLHALGTVAVTGVQPKVRLDRGWDVGFCGSYYYVVQSTKGSAVQVRTRMMEGTMEDPATGSAACGLSILLAMKLGLGRATNFEITQGFEMGRKSDIGVEVTLTEAMDAVERVHLTGSAVKVMEGMLDV